MEEVEQQPLEMAEQRTLRELAAPPVNQDPFCIVAPTLEAPLELKPGLINLLPKFQGLANEDPHKHLKEFHIVCSIMKPKGVMEEQIKLRVFPFSLIDAAKDWLFYLPPGSITTWEKMIKLFLERFFPVSRVINMRREICGIKQKEFETLYDYWERFKRLSASCPQHDISEQFLIHFFYAGLLPTERSMIDVASGGSILNKTPNDARVLISIMAATSQQFGTQNDIPRNVVPMASISSLESKISQLTDLVQKLVVHQVTPAAVCGICASNGHHSDLCPALREDPQAQVNAMDSFQQQRMYDPFSNTYNPGRRDHPNFSYAVSPPNFQNFQPRPPMPQAQPSSSSKGDSSLEDIVKSLALRSQQFQIEVRSSIRNLENQVSKLATSLSKLENQGKLPSQIEVNTRQDLCIITLRSGKELEELSKKDSRKKGSSAVAEPELEVALEKPKEIFNEKAAIDLPTKFMIQPLFL